ncbi:MAG: phosphoserine aminotransferase [Pelagibacteraceae bacterium TMED136]|nr:MAG: phosphoserine aminotransferase [Pelagibacteraceae bacterium TMED136]
MSKPKTKPSNIYFSSGPCKKRPGWDASKFDFETLGRSHRAKPAKVKLIEVIEKSKEILKIPKDYHVGIIAASDTGAVEAAMWNLIGANGIEVLAWESFGIDWAKTITDQLKIKNANVYKAEYGKLPDLSNVNFSKDVLFNWNGTTSGVRVSNADWIPKDRKGLVICDATSAVFAMNVAFEKLDVITWSWQKVLGGEAAHGMIALSPKAVERLDTYTPSWPLPKIYRLTKKGKLAEDIFKGATINTPSMLCVEDALDALAWVESIGGLKGAIRRSNNNLDAVKNWVRNSHWIDFLCEDYKNLSSTSICLKIKDKSFLNLSEDVQKSKIKEINAILEKERVAYDINSYRTAPPGFRIWGGSTVETSDIETLLPWLDWAYTVVNG